MSESNKKAFDMLVSKTKIYLIIIAILLIIISIENTYFIIPSILLFILIVIYAYWTSNKGKVQISQHIQDITINVNSLAKNTLIKSPFPLIIFETDGNVVWKNSKFGAEFGNVPIKSILKDLGKEIKNDIEVSKVKSIKKEVTINDKNYILFGEYTKSKTIKGKKKEQEYIMTSYFIDNTEYLNAIQETENSKTCIGILKIDNYDECMQRVSTEQKPIIAAEVEKHIYDWVATTNGVVIKSDRDTYIYIFEKRYLDQIKENKFDILDQIKEIEVDDGMQVTLSIAVSNDGNTIYEKYKSAMATMDIALGRGGDQAVLKENGKYNFFGGRTLEVEKRTKVKARIVANALEELMKESNDILIMGHTNPDIDSLGSSIGIYRIAKNLSKENVHIVMNDIVPALEPYVKELKESNEYNDLFIDKGEAIAKINNKTLLVVVDTSKINYVEMPELLDKTNKIVVIDHHRRSTEYINNATLTFHEVYASSTAELVTELIQYVENKFKLSVIEAEGLYAGIMVDTKNFTFKTGVRTFEAAAYLRKCGIDILRIKKWFQSNLENYNIISDIVRKSEIVNKSIAISVYDIKSKEASLICAKAADELLNINEITASFVLGYMGDKICISGRSIGDINVQIILEKLGGGGHITLAGAQIENKTMDEVKEMLKNSINEYFSEEI